MKVRIDPDKGTFKVRFTLGDAVNVGVALATVKFVYDFVGSTYTIGLRRLSPKLDDAVEKLEKKKDQLVAEKEKS